MFRGRVDCSFEINASTEQIAQRAIQFIAGAIEVHLALNGIGNRVCWLNRLPHGMQVCMKLAASSIEAIASKLRRRMEDLKLTTSLIAKQTGINQGQVSRIVRGKFRTLDGRAMQLCIFLKIDVAEFDDMTDAKLRRDLEQALWVLWDGTASDAERLRRLLRDLADFRTRPGN